MSNVQAYLYSCHGCPSNTLLDYSPVSSDAGPQCALHARSFWLAWDNDTLLLGEGAHLDQDARLWSEPLLHPILHLGFASQSAGAEVTWGLGQWLWSTSCFAAFFSSLFFSFFFSSRSSDSGLGEFLALFRPRSDFWSCLIKSGVSTPLMSTSICTTCQCPSYVGLNILFSCSHLCVSFL